MVFIEKKNIVNHYNCVMFNEGCPNTRYYSNEMYKCKYWLVKYIELCKVMYQLFFFKFKVKCSYFASCSVILYIIAKNQILSRMRTLTLLRRPEMAAVWKIGSVNFLNIFCRCHIHGIPIIFMWQKHASPWL